MNFTSIIQTLLDYSLFNLNKPTAAQTPTSKSNADATNNSIIFMPIKNVNLTNTSLKNLLIEKLTQLNLNMFDKVDNAAKPIQMNSNEEMISNLNLKKNFNFIDLDNIDFNPRQNTAVTSKNKFDYVYLLKIAIPVIAILLFIFIVYLVIFFINFKYIKLK